MRKNTVIIAIILIVIAGYFFFLQSSNKNAPKPKQTGTPKSQASEADKPQLVKTSPDPLNEAIIPADQIIEISFNKSLQNAPEFKVKIEPKTEFKVELSGDRKTAKIIPVKPYELGTSYTLFIGTETKFDGAGRWGEEKIFHFRTIRYRGI